MKVRINGKRKGNINHSVLNDKTQTKMNLTDLTSKENEYLTILYEYMENGLNRVTTTELASKTYVTLGAVSSILRKFEGKLVSEEKLINYMKGYGVALTQKGKEIAGLLVRKRRIAEVFLSHLGMDFYSIQKQIYKMSLPNEVSNKIEQQFFKDQKVTRCSHGYLVPDKNGTYQFDQLKSLSEFTSDGEVEIVKIPESPFYFIPKYNPSKTDYFLSIYNNNLVPNQRVRILSRTPKTIEIETEGGIDNIPNRGLADQIFVKEV
ncbi:MAG: hypothetical protein ACXAB7_06100 [Candidatus Kariarchaeaceae archaeon]